MQRYIRSHLSDDALIQSAVTHAGSERTATADLLADIAEVDERRLSAPRGYPSTRAWCVEVLHFCEQAALKRIQAARAARRFPAIFAAVAEGRLHLSAVVLLAPHLTEHNAEGLLATATHRSKSAIERMLAERFPKSDVLAWVAAIPPNSSGGPAAPVGESESRQLSPGIVQNGTVASAEPRSGVMPLSADSFAAQFTLSRTQQEKLSYFQDLMSHEIPSGDLAEVFMRAVEIATAQVEKRRCAATTKPRPGCRRSAADSRHIPADVRRAVWERDQGCCTFVSEDGHRCGSRKLVEYDHIEAFAKGGEATVDNVRLLCRAHNRYEADRTYGADFMRHKRIAAAEARAEAKAHAKKVRQEEAAAARARAAEEHAHELEVVPYLRALGCNARVSRDLAAHCRDMRDAPLEERVKVALSHIHVRGTTKIPAPAWAQAVVSASVAAGP